MEQGSIETSSPDTLYAATFYPTTNLRQKRLPSRMPQSHHVGLRSERKTARFPVTHARVEREVVRHVPQRA